jgi:hypothetical protein
MAGSLEQRIGNLEKLYSAGSGSLAEGPEGWREAMSASLRLAEEKAAAEEAQGAVHALPDPVHPPPPEVVEDGLPRREFARQHPPLATGLQHVEDGVQDLLRAMDPRTASPLWSREMRLQQRRFDIREVRQVSLVRHGSDRRLSADAFSDGL